MLNMMRFILLLVLFYAIALAVYILGGIENKRIRRYGPAILFVFDVAFFVVFAMIGVSNRCLFFAGIAVLVGFLVALSEFIKEQHHK